MALRFSTLAIGALLASAAAQHVLLPFSQRSNIPELSARASEQTSLKSAEYTYLVEVEVGTPAQKLTLLISPTTGDTWVPDTNTIECSPEWYYRDSYYDDFDDYDYDTPDARCKWGSFNKTLSSTYLPANQRYSDFGAAYIDGSSVSGTNMTDRLVLGGIEFADYPIGLVSYSTDRWIGVLGLGHNDTSTSTSYYSSNEYSNIMDRMVSSGKIASSAYSMWLDDAEGTSGGLLFGAIDQSRYTGDLVRTSSQSRYSSSTHFGATLSSVNGTSASGEAMPTIRSNDFPIDVTFGPAEVFSYLPELVADQIADMAGATFNRSVSYFTIPCDAGKTNNTKLVFELTGAGGPTLNVETADLVLPADFVDRFGRRITDSDQCLFGIQKYSGSSSSSSSSSYDTYNLGSSVLRRSYLVFDLVNEEIAVAPVRFRGSDAPSPTIVAFESYGAYAPSATSVCTSRYCRSDDGSGSDGGFRGGYGGRGYSGREHWEKVAIGVGVSFGVLVLAGLVVTVVVCVRLRREKAAKGADEESEGDESGAPAMAQNGTRGSMVPGSLPVIQEGSEPTTQAAPQLPALGTQLAGTITPPEPTASANSNRPSVAVSALSDEPQTQVGEPAAVDPETVTPKGKGKEVDRPIES